MVVARVLNSPRKTGQVTVKAVSVTHK